MFRAPWHQGVTNQDREHRFRYRIQGRTNEEKVERLIQKQRLALARAALKSQPLRYDIAPTVINFTRSLLVSFAKPLGEVTDSGLSNTKGKNRTSP